MNAIEPILQESNKKLRKISQSVSLDLIGGKTLSADIQRMKDTLRLEYDGVAIAAPQIGILKRIFVVSGRIFASDDNTQPDDLILINPEIIKTSKKTQMMDEGCLSVRYNYGQVKRFTHVSIRYIDEKGQTQTRGAGGLLAHIFQHEIDHLDGILFIDKAHKLETLTGRDRKRLDLKRRQYVDALDNPSNTQ